MDDSLNGRQRVNPHAAAADRISVDGLRRFVGYLTAQWPRVLSAYALTVAGVLLSLAMPWPLKYLIDSVLAQPAKAGIAAAAETVHPVPGWFLQLTQSDSILLLCITLAGIAILTAVALSVERVLHARVQEQFSFCLRADMIRHVYRICRLSRQHERSGELSMRLTSDVHQVARLFCKSAPMIGRQIGMAVFTLGALYLIEPELGFLATLMTVGFIMLVARYRQPLDRAVRQKRAAEGDLAALTQEAMTGIEHVQSMALEQQTAAVYLDKASRALQDGVSEVRVAVGMERACQIYAGVSLALVAGVGGMAVLNGEQTLGTLTVCLAYVTQLMKPIEKINESAATVTRGLVRARRVDQLFSIPVTDAQPSSGNSALQDAGPVAFIECSHVSFTYPGDQRPTVADFSHVFEQGEMTVLTGTSGSGKSTLLRLLLRLLSPESGEIRVNGRRYADIDAFSLRSQFAVLMQDAFSFTGSVREVLCELAPGTHESQLRQILDDVALLDLVEGMPSGLDTTLGEAAGRLSGGQRSRLLLARAMVSQRRVLVLDEPFANIDTHSRQIILDALQVLRRDRIVIVVTHEDSLVGIADHVLTPGEWAHWRTTRSSHRLKLI